MDVKNDDEDKETNLLCTLLESWGQVVSSINLSTTDTLEFDTMVEALFSEKLRKKSTFETSLLEFECHLDLQADSSNNVCNKRMENEDTN